MSVIAFSKRNLKVEDEWFELDSDEETVSPDLQRFLDQEARLIQPYQEDLETVNLGQGQEKREVSIGTQISGEIRVQLIQLLREYTYIFAWSYRDMPGLD